MSPAERPAPAPHAERVREATETCVRCGACMAVCPVYRAGRREELVARGKLNLLRGLADDELAPGPETVKAVGRCLLCGRCQEKCPNQVPAPGGIQAARCALAEQVGAPFFKRMALTGLLPEPRRLELAARALGPALKAAPALSGLHLRLPALAGLERVPAPSGPPFWAGAPQRVAGPKGAPSLALFAGCVAAYLRPELARHMVRLLSKRFTVLIPPGQGCCGLPALAAGLEEPAARLARRNLDALSAAGADLVVTACGSCAHTLAAELPRLAPGPEADRLAGRVREVSQVLCQEPALLAGRGQGRAAAVHDPCHLKIGMGVSEEPRAMLAAAGAEVVAMAGADQCCGGGGLFSLAEPGLSRRIFAPRRDAFLQSGATVLATSCSGCWLQWRRGLEPDAAVVHPIELLEA